MNCPEITHLLDDGDIGNITDAERGRVEAHLLACSDCAVDWKVHQRLVSTSTPPVPNGLVGRCRQLVAAGNVRRTPSRAILFGTVLLVATAAAALGLRLASWSPEVAPVESTAIVAVPEQQPASPPSASAPESVPEVATSSPTQARAPNPANTSPAPTLFTVRVFPLGDGAADISRDADVERFYRSLLDELRKVPGLALLTQESTGHESDPVDHELRVSRRESAPGMLQTMVNVAILSRPASSGGFRAVAGSSSMVMGIQWSGPGDVEREAKHVVEQLRLTVFRPDPVLQQEQLAKLSDPAAQAGLRQQALNSLLRFDQVGLNGATADPAAIRAAVDLATTAGNPDERESTWRMLQTMRHPDLGAAMIKALGTEASDKVRLMLVGALSRDYASNAEVRAVLESVAQGDSRQLTRMAAQRGLGSEEAWNSYMISTLKNPELTDPQRLEPLTYMLANGGYNPRRLQLDDDTVRILGKVVAGAGADSSSPNTQQAANAMQAMNLLGNLRTPVARDVLIDIASSRVGQSDSGINLQTAALRILVSSYRDDARAREAVDEVLADESNPQLRRNIEEYRSVMERFLLRP